VSDERFRKLERLYKASGSLEDYQAWARERCRVGDCCGHANPDTIPIPRPSVGAYKAGLVVRAGGIRGMRNVPHAEKVVRALEEEEEFNPATAQVQFAFHGHRPHVEAALEWIQKAFSTTHIEQPRELAACLGSTIPKTQDEIDAEQGVVGSLAEDLGLPVGDIADMQSLLRGEAPENPIEFESVNSVLRGEGVNPPE